MIWRKNRNESIKILSAMLCLPAYCRFDKTLFGCLLCEKSNNENGAEKRLDSDFSHELMYVCLRRRRRRHVSTLAHSSICFFRVKWRMKLENCLCHALCMHTQYRIHMYARAVHRFCRATAYDRIIRFIDFGIHVKFVFRLKGVKFLRHSSAMPTMAVTQVQYKQKINWIDLLIKWPRVCE